MTSATWISIHRRKRNPKCPVINFDFFRILIGLALSVSSQRASFDLVRIHSSHGRGNTYPIFSKTGHKKGILSPFYSYPFPPAVAATHRNAFDLCGGRVFWRVTFTKVVAHRDRALSVGSMCHLLFLPSVDCREAAAGGI